MVNKYKLAGQFAEFKNLRDMVYKSQETFQDKTLYIYTENDERKEWSYNDLRSNMDALGTAFSKLGLMGKRIAIIGETHPMYTTTYLATVSGNGTVIPLDKELDMTQVVGFLNHSEADAIAYTGSFNKKIEAVKDELPNMKLYIPIQPDESYEKSENVISASDLIEIGKAELSNGNTSFTELEIDVEKRSAILFTSGTTGTSKGVMLSHKNIIFTLNSSVNSTSFDENCTFISILPIHHSYEMMCGQLGVIAIGATELINDSLKKVLKNLREFQPTTMIMVPMVLETMHKKVWDEIRKKGLESKVRLAMKMNSALLKVGVDVREKLFGQITSAFGGKLKCIVCGGAPVSPEIVRDFHQFGIMVLEGYGITECSPLVAVTPYGRVRLHSVGPAIQNIDVKVDYDEGQKTGEILVKGDNVMLGYFKDEQATADVFTEDGYFRTGDIGYIKDGYIYITGRKKNVIILSNGKNVFPEEIEEYISRIPFVLESVVLGRENANGEVAITAIVVPDMNNPEIAGKTPSEIYSATKDAVININKHLPSFKHVTNVEVRYEEFEKNTSKKIKRYKIK